MLCSKSNLEEGKQASLPIFLSAHEGGSWHNQIQPNSTTFCNKRFGMFRASVKPQYMITCNTCKRYSFHLTVCNTSSPNDSTFTSNIKVFEETSDRCRGLTHLCSSERHIFFIFLLSWPKYFFSDWQ